jgi:cold shock CspA family protein
MGRSQTTFQKREREKKKARKKMDKMERREEKRDEGTSGKLEDMMAYVDEFGNILDTPPDPAKKTKVKAKDIIIGVPPQAEVDPVHQGRVAFFNDSKGYGFINETGTQERYFVHVNGLTEEVRENDKVSFELERGPQGMNAVNVKKVA